jgi:hypothetical protein
MLGWHHYEFNKKCVVTCYAELVFLRPMGTARHVVHAGAFGEHNDDALFFLVKWGLVQIQQKMRRDTLAEPVFLHPVGSTGHVVHSEVRNDDAPFFMLWWHRYEFNKKRIGKHYTELVFLHPVGTAGHIVDCDASEECNGEALFFMVGWGLVRI